MTTTDEYLNEAYAELCNAYTQGRITLNALRAVDDLRRNAVEDPRIARIEVLVDAATDDHDLYVPDVRAALRGNA